LAKPFVDCVRSLGWQVHIWKLSTQFSQLFSQNVDLSLIVGVPGPTIHNHMDTSKNLAQRILI